MAVTIGNSTEQWLLGVDRLVATTVDLFPKWSSMPWKANRAPARWLIERGTIEASAPVDVYGGFPGSIRSANVLERTQVIATARYLIVGEGTLHGFMLPLNEIFGAGVVRPSRQANHGLVVRFRDGVNVGTFAMHFRGLSRGFSSVRRADAVMNVLREHGVPQLDESRVSGPPRLAFSWEEARSFASEPLIWSGTAMAAVGGWYGATQRPCRVWLSKESLFWSAPEGHGVNRLQFQDIAEVRDGYGERLIISTRDGLGHRFDIPFVFGTRAMGSRQRVEFLNALASYGIALRTASPVMAPWRRGGMVRPTHGRR